MGGIKDCGYWSGVLPLRAASRPPIGDPPVPELVVGSDRVDLRQALTELASRTGARSECAASGGPGRLGEVTGSTPWRDFCPSSRGDRGAKIA
jgi:hypothetical protein